MKSSPKPFLVATLILVPLACAHSVDAPQNVATQTQSIRPLPDPRELDSVYLTSPIYPDLTVGFLIDQAGVNYPALRISGKESGLWAFPEILQSVFTLNQNPAVNDVLGNVYTLRYPIWVLSSTHLKPMSQVLSFEPTLVACTKPAITKESSSKGDCYSTSKGWSFAYDLRAPAPAICGDVLRLISREKTGSYLKEIIPSTGRVAMEIPLSKTGENICNISKK